MTQSDEVSKPDEPTETQEELEVRWMKHVADHGTAVDIAAAGFDNDAPPLDTEGVETEDVLRDALAQLRAVADAASKLDERKKQLQLELIPMLLARRRVVMFNDAHGGGTLLAGPRQAENLVVDHVLLGQMLVVHYAAAHPDWDPQDCADEAEAVVASVLKDPAVDVKEGGRFAKAVATGKIPIDIAGAVSHFQKTAAYVGFSKAK